MSFPWPSKALADICEIKPPKREAKRKLKDEDLVSFVPMEDLGTDQKFLEPKAERQLGQVAGSYTYFADGDVLLAKITPCFENGKLGIAKELTNGIGFGSSEYIVFRPRADLSNQYLYYFLLQDRFRDEGIRSMSGAVGHKRVSKEFVERCQIPLPALVEQQRIVAILDEAFEGLATATAGAEKNIKNARELFDSYLKSIFVQSSEEWEERPLGDLCALFVDSAHRTPKYQPEGIPALRPRDVVNGKLLLDGAAKVSQEEYAIQSKRHRPSPGDVVYSRELSYGWAALLPETPRVCLSQGMCLFRPKPGIEPSFLLYVLNGPIGRQQAMQAAVGTAHPHINLGDIKAYRIPMTTLSKQRQVVAELDALSDHTQRLATSYADKLKMLSDLRQSILRKAFSGELTSPPSQVIQEAAE